MDGTEGTTILFRAHLRRDRWMIGWWILGNWVLYLSQAVSVKGLYATQAQLDDAAASMAGNRAFIAMAGPPRALDTIGGQVAWQAGAFGAVVAGLMSMFLIGRHTRAEEETGRDELVRAGAVGRLAPMSAAVAVATLANVVLGLALAGGLIAYGLDVTGSLALAVAVTLTGLVFMGAALVAAQLTASTRAMYGLTGAFIAVAYVLRAVGDVGTGALSWLSPIGWGQYMRAYADEQWWPALLAVVATIALLGTARALFERRDIGEGLWPARPGPPSSTIGSFGLAWRLQRASVLGWAAGLLLTGLAYGTIGDSAGDVVGDSQFANDVFGGGTGSITAGFYATAIVMLALLAAGFAISSALRPHKEEELGRVELLMSTPEPRLRWALGHTLITVAGTVVVVALGGFGLGLSYGLAVGDLSQIGRMTVAALAYIPAVLVLSGLVRLLWGASSHLAQLAWVALGFCVVVLFFAAALRMPAWLVDLSPFSHVGLVPAVPFAAWPVVALTLIAATLTTAGHALFSGRDLD